MAFERKRKNHFILIIHNVRSTHNVGAMFRTADAAGVSKMYLSGYTPAPLDRFGRPRQDITKTSLGAEKSVSWEKRLSLSSLVSKLKKENYLIVALEQDKRAIDYKKFSPPKKTALIVGNEVSGLSPNILKKCDQIIQIPMRGRKESLNASVALGVALYRLLDR